MNKDFRELEREHLEFIRRAESASFGRHVMNYIEDSRQVTVSREQNRNRIERSARNKGLIQ